MMLFYLNCLIFINISYLFFYFIFIYILFFDDNLFIVYYSPHYTDDRVLRYHLVIEHKKRSLMLLHLFIGSLMLLLILF